jgi:hypothetical protein
MKVAEAEDVERAHAAEQKAKEGRATLQRKRDELVYKGHEARRVADRVELAQRARQADDIVASNRALAAASSGEKTAALRARLTPLLEKAKKNLAWLIAFQKTHEPYLATFAGKTWKEADARWEPKLRVEWAEKVAYASELFLRELRLFIGHETAGNTGTIRDAEKMLKRGWQAGRDAELAESEIQRRLGYAAEPGLIPHMEQKLHFLLGSIRNIEDKGRAQLEASGGKVPEVVILLSPEARLQRAAAKAEGEQQQYATGTPGHEGGAGSIIPRDGA